MFLLIRIVKQPDAGLDNMRLNHLYCEASALRLDGRK
jgi:hypothetical protein